MQADVINSPGGLRLVVDMTRSEYDQLLAYVERWEKLHELRSFTALPNSKRLWYVATYLHVLAVGSLWVINAVLDGLRKESPAAQQTHIEFRIHDAKRRIGKVKLGGGDVVERISIAPDGSRKHITH